jgi:hypothetical protein
MKNMYKDVKYAIKFADGETCMFSSKVGVKQRCILSGTLFSIYLNVMVKIFGVTCDPTNIFSDDFTRLIKYHNFSFVYIDTQIPHLTVIRQLIQAIL